MVCEKHHKIAKKEKFCSIYCKSHTLELISFRYEKIFSNHKSARKNSRFSGIHLRDQIGAGVNVIGRNLRLSITEVSCTKRQSWLNLCSRI